VPSSESRIITAVITVPLQGCLKYNSVQEGNTATFFMCLEIPTMNFGKLIETPTYLLIRLALPLVRTWRGERGWATMMNTMAGQEEEEALV
jgi:hypothetical protein